ncbi:hypothetical protein ABXT63_03895 [Candidatus Pelagibacter sp. Uisw_092]|uniref:hypothetical protein n=1 Tax=Candidatus Pelagibacter sp. Uisw_092 TaxID=3230979 RepID=UPI0039E81186
MNKGSFEFIENKIRNNFTSETDKGKKFSDLYKIFFENYPLYKITSIKLRRFKVFFIREKAWEEGLFKFSKLYYSAKPYSINIFNIKENKCFE